MKISTILLYIVLLIIVGFLFMYLLRMQAQIHTQQTYTGKEHTCPLTTCGSIDPVSDPAYNMGEIAKNSLLLEDHIAIKAKRCRDCCLKHFLLLIGYSEEATTLACNRLKTFPLLDGLSEFYNDLMKEYLKFPNDEEHLTNILSKLREKRKEIVAAYYGEAPT